MFIDDFESYPKERTITERYTNMYEGGYSPKKINLNPQKEQPVPKKIQIVPDKEPKKAHIARAMCFGASVKRIGNYNITDDEIVLFSTEIDDFDKVRYLIREIDIGDTKSIIEFGNDITISSRTTIDKLLKVNLETSSKMPQYLAKISSLIKNSYKKKGFFESIFGFEDEKTLQSTVHEISNLENMVEQEIPKILNTISYIETLYMESKVSMNEIQCYIVAMQIVIKEFTEQDISKLTEVDKKLYESNRGLLEKKLYSLMSIKLSMSVDPFVIFNTREYYIASIDIYKTDVSNLIHEWINECNLEINSKKNNYKETGKQVTKMIDSLTFTEEKK